MKVKAYDADGKLVMTLRVESIDFSLAQHTLDKWMADFKVKHPCGSFQIC